MGDLQNDFPSWGETGALPTAGFFYEGGDQVNEKHLDALWHNVKTHFDLTHTAIRDRVRDIPGDVILDSGLVASKGSNTREVDVSASNAGAYVDGQKTGSTSATTLTLSSNGTTSTRTDSIWVDTNGSIGTSEGTTSVSDSRMKIAEVDVASDDTISAIRNKGRDRARVFASENAPDTQFDGDVWYDYSASKMKGYINGAWRPILPADGSQPMVGNLDLNGNTLTDGDGTLNIGTSTSISGALDLSGDIATSGGTTIWDSSNGHIPSGSIDSTFESTVSGPQINVNGVTGTGSTDGSDGIGAPSVYTDIVEATTEKGGSSTYVELGSGGPHSGVGSDEIALITQGNVQFKVNATNPTYQGNKVWHEGNMGDGSGLDADTVDGIESSNLGMSTEEKAIYWQAV